jgi:hypothetical protein
VTYLDIRAMLARERQKMLLAEAKAREPWLVRPKKRSDRQLESYEISRSALDGNVSGTIRA